MILISQYQFTSQMAELEIDIVHYLYGNQQVEWVLLGEGTSVSAIWAFIKEK